VERAPTRLVTLNHLIGLTSIEDAADVVGPDPEETSPAAERLTVAGCEAAWFVFQGTTERAPWAEDAAITLGRALDVREQRSGGVLLIEVDGRFYALSYGQGFRRIRDDARDPRFGLRVAIRCLDGSDLNEVIRRRPGSGRIESTLVPGGAPVLWLRPGNLSEIVRRIGGRTLPLPLTYRPPGERGARLHGAGGLRLRLGLRPEDLIADIRAIAAIGDRPAPLADLAFVDDVAPVDDPQTRRRLDARVEDLLAEPEEGGLALAVPDSALESLDRTVSYRIRIGATSAALDDLTLPDVTAPALREPAGTRLSALRTGQIWPCDQPGGRRPLTRPAAVKWIEATVRLGERHFALLDGIWHEFDQDFARRVRREVAGVFTNSTALPGWEAGSDEAGYNRHVQSVAPGYLCLDRKLVRDRDLHRAPGLELCDLLGPDDELIHVKQAKGSATLSHLFAQGLVSWQSLRGLPEIRQGFRRLVEDVGGGRQLPEDFVPDRIVFAILLGTGRPLTPDTLFPFAQAALAQTAAELRERHVRVEVVGIRPLPAAA
jgi:uncharacterized protein (TIGR04141 family)